LAGLIALSFGGWMLHRQLSRAKHQIDQQIAEAGTATGEPPLSPPAVDFSPEDSPPVDQAEQRLALLTRRQQQTTVTDRIGLLNLGRWLVVWALVLGWVVAIALLINRYPLRQFTAWEVLLKPQFILMVWFVMGLANRLLDLLLWRASGLMPVSATDSAEEIQRRQLRVSTTANVISGLKTVMLYLLAIFFSLNLLGLNTNSLLAFGALLGLAISLATQNVIKDLVNGFLVLLEDQYAIGDVIEVDPDTSGLVENLNLRVTQLRDGSGRLITLPNSQISRVVNLTRLWARMDETVCVDANADIHQALEVVKTTAYSLYTDPQFRDAILEAPEVLGVETINHAGVEIHTQIKTKPAQQWTIAREFRLRLKTALDEKGIPFGRPQRDVWHHSPSRED
jgi:small conductance mechanosensitive channel